MSYGDHALSAVFRGLKSKGVQVYELASEDLPDLLIADDSFGLIAMDVAAGTPESDLDEQAQKSAKARKLRALRVELDNAPREIPIRYITIAVPGITEDELKGGNAFVRNVNLDAFQQSEGIDDATQKLIEIASMRFDAAFIFVGTPRLPVSENLDQKNEREQQRFLLDKEQISVARRTTSALDLVSGPPGSGKTLVLIARAKLLARQNPNWVIRIVCFNNALKPFLAERVKNLRNVEVHTFYELTQKNAVSFKMKGATEQIALKDYSRNQPVVANCDAILVDEAQDFYSGWLKYLAQNVRPGRGGVLLVGDETQSLYRDANFDASFGSEEVNNIRLNRPYRSTRQILEFVGQLLPEAEVKNSECAPEGSLPELIYVQGGLANHAQAHALAVDIKRALDEDPSLEFKDIGILCTRHFEIKGLAGDLRKIFDDIFGSRFVLDPVFQGFSGSLDLSRNSVKLLTMHSAKGLEFRNVYLVGLEMLANGLKTLPQDYMKVAELRETTLNLIGPTRAKDRLTVYYSKDNLFLKRLAKHGELYRTRRYPDDYEVPESWLS